jgi:signal transduction histidine kinase
MDVQLNNRVTFISTIVIIITTAFLLLHTTHFSIELCSLACVYVVIVVIRNYVLKLDLHRLFGTVYIVLQMVICLVITVWSESFFAQVYTLILVGEFALYHSRTHSLIFTIVSYVSCVFSLLIYQQFPPFSEIYYIFPRVIDYLAIFGISLLAKVAFQQKNQLIRDNKQLLMASIELEKNAILLERTRISRDIHDSVGHTLTSALTGLQTASHAIKKNEFPLALDMISRTNETILRGLNNVRTSVHVLRENSPGEPFISKLIGFINETAKQTEVDIGFEIDPTIPDLPPVIELTLYRALQEGITNGIRHGASKYFQFSLVYQSGTIRFILSDKGKAPSQIVPGFGLKSMKERVEEVGGELAISSSESRSGVTLKITIPIQSTIGQKG